MLNWRAPPTWQTLTPREAKMLPAKMVARRLKLAQDAREAPPRLYPCASVQRKGGRSLWSELQPASHAAVCLLAVSVV